ncbi:hypothetical protein LSH36_36g06030 [Paralvinella palmiformis]|uniref:Ubiquitin-like protease family profile domain-containing protein n=1 Tax=Paralvinella palmiformis TaxID=53620 RepID=A0AAD9K945_9ANNE|nr:hypothetical protein LSH36_36g06030 [Paralvinella palmiformis]
MVVHCLSDMAVCSLTDLPVDSFRRHGHVMNFARRRRQTPRNLVTREWNFSSSEKNNSSTRRTRSRSPVDTCHDLTCVIYDSTGADGKIWLDPDTSSPDDDLPAIIDSFGSVSVIDEVNDIQEQADSFWIPQLHLTKSDREELLSGEMLTDKHIFAAQKLLSQQTPHISGLQDPVMSQIGFKPVHRESLQIHHTRGLHWVMSSWTPGDLVHVYDTLYDFVSQDLLRQLEEIYVDAPRGEDGHVLYDMPPVHKQHGCRDCGLFAVALATELCTGTDVTKVHFDQSKMREHLYKCLRKRQIEPFPAEYIVL